MPPEDLLAVVNEWLSPWLSLLGMASRTVAATNAILSFVVQSVTLCFYAAETFPGSPFATQHMLLSPYMRTETNKKKASNGKVTVSEALKMPLENDAYVRVRLAGSHALAQLAVAWCVIVSLD